MKAAAAAGAFAGAALLVLGQRLAPHGGTFVTYARNSVMSTA